MILGCSGPVLTETERSFFARSNPLGFILFARNVVDPVQVAALVASLRDCVGRADAPVLIDQEGGRVQRLRPPHWRNAPPPAEFARLYQRDPEAARAALRLNYRLIGAELAALGIDVDCAPVLDLPVPGADAVIGDRALGHSPAQAAELGRAVCDGLLDEGVLPVIKHIPGHGRAMVDSHLSLPVVPTTLAELDSQDFEPFRRLADQPWAMTAHVVYSAIDPDAPATTSAKVISQVIRGAIGFDGVLISDDLSMQALGGGFADRALSAVRAGCDLVLHCNGQMAEMEPIARVTPPVTEQGLARLERAARAKRAPLSFDRAAAARQVGKALS